MRNNYPFNVIAKLDELNNQEYTDQLWITNAGILLDVNKIEKGRDGSLMTNIPFKFELVDYLNWRAEQGTGIIWQKDSNSDVYYTGGDVAIASTKPTNITAKLHVIGTGATSATTAFLVENSAGLDALSVTDDGVVSMAGTTNVKIPVGTTAQRPGTPVAGDMRFNTTTSKFEGWDGSAWQNFH